MISDTEHVPNSMREAILDLPVGESFSKCRRIPYNEATRERIHDDTMKVKNTLGSATRRAQETKPRSYTTEMGSFNTRGGIMVLGIVTRIA